MRASAGLPGSALAAARYERWAMLTQPRLSAAAMWGKAPRRRRGALLRASAHAQWPVFDSFPSGAMFYFDF